MENNNLYADSATSTRAISEFGNLSGYTDIRNNNFYGFAVTYYDFDGNCSGNADGDNDATTCTLAEMEGLTDFTGSASNNISVDPMFADIDGFDNDITTMINNDWRFSPDSPMSVTAGGLNGIDEGWTFNSDFYGIARPATGSPWAIGAFEP